MNPQATTPTTTPLTMDRDQPACQRRTQLHAAATRFVYQHQGAHLDRQQLIARTVWHLQEHYAEAFADRTLERVAHQAVCDLEARDGRYWIDVDRSTATHVTVRMGGSDCAWIIGVVELVQWVQNTGLARIATQAVRPDAVMPRAARLQHFDGNAS